MFQPGDLVNYVGDKWSSELKSKLGEVISKVWNERGAFVVDFGDGDYICSERNLLKAKPIKSSDVPKVSRRRRDEED